MTVVRMAAHRAGWIHQMLPQAVEAWLRRESPLSLPAFSSKRAAHHLTDQLLHLGYGSTLGTLYGLTLGRERASFPKVLGFGVANWAFGSFVLLPALKIMRPEWRAKPQEIAVNVAAHLLYAGALALVMDEFEQQSAIQPFSYPLSIAAKTG